MPAMPNRNAACRRGISPQIVRIPGGKPLSARRIDGYGLEKSEKAVSKYVTFTLSHH